MIGGQSMIILLVAPDPPGKLIRRLTGKIPVKVTTRASEPVIVPLARGTPAERQVSTGNMTLGVDEISLEPGNRASVRVVVRPNRDGLAPRAGGAERRTTAVTYNRSDAIEHLELCDAAGKRIHYVLGEQTSSNDGQGFFSRFRLVVAPAIENGPPMA